MTSQPEPDASDLLGAAMNQHRQGDLAGADILYEQFLEIDPDHAQALRLHGVLARELDDLDRSRALLQRACAAAPADAAPANELALTCLAGNDFPAAEVALRTAIDLDPRPARALANLGALLQYRGHLAAAIDCHQRVLELTPDDLQVCCNLANTLADAGRGEEALTVIDTALARVPGHPYLLAARGAALISMHRYDDALDSLQQSVARNPADELALVNLAYAQARLGQSAEALKALQRAAARNPDNARAVADLANLLASNGTADEALRICEEFLARHPGERMVLASYALALRDAGRAEEALALTDPDRLVLLAEPATPQAFASADAFHAALRDAILSQPSLLAEPASKATRGGRQTGELDLASNPALEAFGRMIEAEVPRMLAKWEQEGFAEHPLMAYRSRRWSLRAWGTVLERGGQQAPHQHPLAFISGVYYVSVPAGLPAEGGQAGWLEFGRPPGRLGHAVAPETRAIEPVAGRLVVFPAWFWHRTLPFETAETRVSIAFDVVPRS